MKIFTLLLLLNISVFLNAGNESGKNINIADPTVFFENGLYYLYGTEPIPETGFPVFISNDLITWKKSNLNNNYVLKKDRGIYGNQGFWAPQIIRYNNQYYIFYTANEQIAVAQSNSPHGPFLQKIVSPIDSKSKLIDPFLFIDEDGKMYLYHVRLGGGNKIYVAEFNKDFSGIKEETLTHCISAEENWENTKRIPAPPIAEGPTVIKHKDIYYLFYSANDFRNIDYAVGYATATSPIGPWNKYPKNPIIHRENIGINGTGHGDVFQDKNGKFHYVFHAHANDSTVNPRQTLIVEFNFVKNEATGIDEVVINAKSLSLLLK